MTLLTKSLSLPAVLQSFANLQPSSFVTSSSSWSGTTISAYLATHLTSCVPSEKRSLLPVGLRNWALFKPPRLLGERAICEMMFVERHALLGIRQCKLLLALALKTCTGT